MYAKKIVFSAITAPALGKFPSVHLPALFPTLQCSCTKQLNIKTVVARRKKKKLLVVSPF